MSTKRATTPFLSVSKCKRIVRPLVSKIHKLTDMIAKYPSNLDFNFPYDHFEKQHRSSTLRACRSSSNTPRQSTQTSNIPSCNQTSGLSGPDDYKLPKAENDDELDASFQISDKSPSKKNVSPACPDLWFKRFSALINPRNSKDRLTSLEPFLSPELYQAYAEIFMIFKNIISTLRVAEEKSDSPISSLSSLSATSMGRSIALSTKSTYYMTSRSSLFDPEKLPDHLRQFQKLLSDDIDDWLEMNPSVVIQSYRGDLLLGYVIHLLVINSQQSLYLLLPVLIHWLHDEFEVSRDFRFKFIMRYLFSEYWNYGVTNSDAQNQNEMTMALLGGNSRSYALNLFWILLDIGYWEELIDSLRLQSSLDKYSNYDSLILEVLVINDKLNISSFGIFDKHIHIDKIIYPILRRNPQHPHSNAVFASIITQILVENKNELKLCTSSERTLELVLDAYNQTVIFLRVWLSFPSKSSWGDMIFNSLYPGNEEIFGALIKFVTYLHSRIKRVIKYLLISTSSLDMKYSIKSLLNKFDRLSYKLSSLLVTISLLKAYFLDLNEETNFGMHDVRDIFESFVNLQDMLQKQNSANSDLDDFLLWLYDRQDPLMVELAQLCFQYAYGSGRRFKDTLINNLYSLLFEREQAIIVEKHSYSSEEEYFQSQPGEHSLRNKSPNLSSSDASQLDSEDDAPKLHLNKNRMYVGSRKLRCIEG